MIFSEDLEVLFGKRKLSAHVIEEEDEDAFEELKEDKEVDTQAEIKE